MVPLVISAGIFGWFGGEPQKVLLPGGATKELWLQNAAFVWVVPILVSSLLAFLMMNDIADVRASFREQAVIFRNRHTWIMCWLYLGTFGSFIGFSAGFPLLIKSQFPGVNPLEFAWMGPFLGAVIRPVGGWLADKVGGARVTLWNFIVMIGAVFGVLHFLPLGGQSGNLTGFFVSFMVLFVTSGIGNGSTFRMIPVIFMSEARDAAQDADPQAVLKNGNKQAAAVLGFSAAMGAYGGFFIPKSYGTSITLTGSPHAALWLFIVFYITCIVITWWFYARRNAARIC
jgi:NNP family nitrate/nitrite transporter-like MFS transporter